VVRGRKRPNEILAKALRGVKTIAENGIVKSSDLKRQDREILVSAGSLTEIIRGWYLLTSPEAAGSTAWFGGFWAFLMYYLNERFGEDHYCLSAESSLSLYAGDTEIPKQIVVLTKKASNKNIDLPYNTSILLLTDSKNFPEETETVNGIKAMTLPSALCRVTPSYYKNRPSNIEIVLKLSSLSVSAISRALLETSAIASTERIIGAFRALGEERKADQIKGDLEAAGYKLKEVNPFEAYEAKLSGFKFTSPYGSRIKILWHSMRDEVFKFAPKIDDVKNDSEKIIKIIQERYKEDAYHSLSIEGYQVTEELIDKIEQGEWDPENNQADRTQKDAMAAKGYHNAFQVVIKSIIKALNGNNSASVLEEDLQSWYRELFAPTVKANLLQMERLAGYRKGQVYIKSSRHVPPPSTALLDCMETLFDLLKSEENAFIRGVLGHFIFVYIHPYMDGNGRMGRFLMNFMFISGGIPWTVIKTSCREKYMQALEAASTNGDIKPFVEFIKSEVGH
jgi:hypothetical protein